MKKKQSVLILASILILQSASFNAFAADTEIPVTEISDTNFTEAFAENPPTARNTEETTDGFTYFVQDDGTIAIMKYTGGLSDVTIPSEINGRTVSTIGNEAFAKQNLTAPLTSVVIPDSITTIYNYAFAFNDTLTEITLPDSITWIGSSVFVDCGFTSIRLPQNLTIINEYLFMDCTSLENIKLPENITAINRSAFANCSTLTEVSVPYGVTLIDDNAFARCASLQSVDLPSTVKTIGSSTFYGCNNDLVLYVYEDSYALEYAQTNNYTCHIYKNAPYYDVTPADWYYKYVNWAYSRNLMTGYKTGNFGPADLLTRGQFTIILHRYEGAPAVTLPSPFPDVEAGLYYTDAVIWAKEAGIIGGYDNGNFGPVDNMNREQLATMMYRYASTKGYPTTKRADLSSFPDASNVQPFAQEAMQWAVAEGLISGDNGYLNPQSNANRAVTATIIYRFFNIYL